MKKSWRLLALLLALLFCCILAACHNDGEPAVEPPTDEADAAAGSDDDLVQLVMATGSTSGNYFPFGGALAHAVAEKTAGISIEVRATGASVENLELLGLGEAELAIVQNDVLDYAFHGTNIYQGDTPQTNIATLCSLYPEVCQLIVAADSGIESVADLANLRVSLGDVGSGVEANAVQILAAYDLTKDDIQVKYLNFADSAAALKEKEIDAFFITAGTPNSAVMDLQTLCEIKIIGIEDEKIESLLEKHPFYTKITLTENDYSFLSEPLNTVAVQATLVCSKSLDSELAYQIVKAVIEGKELIMSANAKGAYLSSTYAVQGVSVDFHPGAEKYFGELGVL